MAARDSKTDMYTFNFCGALPPIQESMVAVAGVSGRKLFASTTPSPRVETGGPPLFGRAEPADPFWLAVLRWRWLPPLSPLLDPFLPPGVRKGSVFLGVLGGGQLWPALGSVFLSQHGFPPPKSLGGVPKRHPDASESHVEPERRPGRTQVEPEYNPSGTQVELR